MTEEQGDKAHAIWEQLYDMLRSTVHNMMEAAELDDDQCEYVFNKLHDELRYWK